MTRKRFIKLMMARGYSRNLSKDFARGVVSKGFSYEMALNLSVFLRTSTADALAEAAKCLSKVVGAVVCGIEAFLRAVSDALREADDNDQA